jgi:ABC-type transporter Mla subunit MlaD
MTLQEHLDNIASFKPKLTEPGQDLSELVAAFNAAVSEYPDHLGELQNAANDARINAPARHSAM